MRICNCMIDIRKLRLKFCIIQQRYAWATVIAIRIAFHWLEAPNYAHGINLYYNQKTFFAWTTMTVIMVCESYWSRCDIIQKLLIHIRQFMELDFWLNILLKLFSVKLEPSSGTRGNSRPAVPGSDPSATNNGRPSKRHGNAHKREKLRRTFVHLDAWTLGPLGLTAH